MTDKEFPTTTAGYRRAVAWLIEHGPLQAVGVEGTSSYGVGGSTTLFQVGVKVIEVNRTRPAEGASRASPTGWMPTVRLGRAVRGSQYRPETGEHRTAAGTDRDSPLSRQGPAGGVASDWCPAGQLLGPPA